MSKGNLQTSNKKEIKVRKRSHRFIKTLRSSLLISLWSFWLLLLKAFLASTLFFSCSCNILSSIVSLAINLTIFTSSFCPILWTLSIACSSIAGFHHGSTKYTVEAAVRFIPAFDAFKLASKIVGPSGAGTPKSLITFALLLALIDPSKRITLKPAALRGSSSKSNIFRNWEKMTDLELGFASLDANRSFRSATTLDDDFEDEPSVVDDWEASGGGALKRSDSESGWRHIGQLGLVRFIVLRMHDSQKMWAQHVIMISVGGDMQIGQSKSSPSCKTESSFCNNVGLFFTSAWIWSASVNHK